MSDKNLSNNLFESLVILSESLREKGFKAESMALDEKIRNYKTAEVHLYNAFEETGEDLINRAHPDGEVEMAPSKDGHGVIETQNTEHAKMLKVVEKTPHGKLAAQDLVMKTAIALEVGLEKVADSVFETLKGLEFKDLFPSNVPIGTYPIMSAETARKDIERQVKEQKDSKLGVSKDIFEVALSDMDKAKKSCDKLMLDISDDKVSSYVGSKLNLDAAFISCQKNSVKAGRFIAAINRAFGGSPTSTLENILKELGPEYSGDEYKISQAARQFANKVVSLNQSFKTKIDNILSPPVKQKPASEVITKTKISLGQPAVESGGMEDSPSPLPAEKPAAPAPAAPPAAPPAATPIVGPTEQKASPKGPIVSPKEEQSVKAMQGLLFQIGEIINQNREKLSALLPKSLANPVEVVTKLFSTKGSRSTGVKDIFDGLWGPKTNDALNATKNIVVEWNEKFKNKQLPLIKSEKSGAGALGESAAGKSAELAVISLANENSKALTKLQQALSGGTGAGRNAKYSVEITVEGKPVTLTELDSGSLNSMFKLLLRSGVVHALKDIPIVPESAPRIDPSKVTNVGAGAAQTAGKAQPVAPAQADMFYDMTLKFGQRGAGYNISGNVLVQQKGPVPASMTQPTADTFKRLGLTKSQWEKVLNKINKELISGAEGTIGDEAKTDAYTTLQRMVYDLYQELQQKTGPQSGPDTIVDVSGGYSGDMGRIRDDFYGAQRSVDRWGGGSPDGRSYGDPEQEGAPSKGAPPITNEIDFRHPLWASQVSLPPLMYKFISLDVVKGYSFDVNRALSWASIMSSAMNDGQPGNRPLTETLNYIGLLKQAMEKVFADFSSTREPRDRAVQITQTWKERWIVVLDSILQKLLGARTGSPTR